MPSPPPTAENPPEPELQPEVQLADYLLARQDAILRSWRSAADQDERLAIVSHLGRTKFEDNLPLVLTHLCTQLHQQLELEDEAKAELELQAQSIGEGEITLAPAGAARTAPSPEKQSAILAGRAHGFHRWQEGYDLRQMMAEWGHFTETIVRVINEYEAAHPGAEPGLTARNRLVCAQLLDQNLMRSVDAYYRVQQSEAKEVVQTLSQALQEVSKWERQRGQVLREAVHDLRGNLTAVQGATHLLDNVAGKKSDPELKKSIVGIVQRSTETLYHMLTSLLDLARLEAGEEERETQDFDVTQLLGELCDTLAPLAQSHGLTLHSAGPAELRVTGDAIKVHRIAQNLLLNSLKYTRRGGVEIEWQKHEPESWRLTISDTGPGFIMRTDDLPFVPEISPQHSAELPSEDTPPEGSEEGKLNSEMRSFPGEGVGLAIVKRLCMMLDAQLEVDSTVGVGTKFQVTFPAT